MSLRNALMVAGFALCVVALNGTVHATSTSYTGTLGSGQVGDTCSAPYAASCYYTLTFNVAATSDITIQSWGFGGTNGGTNAAGNVINAGGFDELIALWSGTGAGATLIDGSADVLVNYGSYIGCPPAGTVAFSNGDAVCGDLMMQFFLAAGTYMITLSDAEYQPNALTCCGTTLGDGFSDLTSGVFQDCDFNPSNGQTACVTPNANWAFDLSINPVPEPPTLALMITGFGLVWRRTRTWLSTKPGAARKRTRGRHYL
jgi:hypothetical protein